MIISNVSIAENFIIKTVPTGTAYISTSDKSSGDDLWSTKTTIQKVSYKGRPMVYVEDKGQGIWGNDKKNETWVTRSYFYLNGTTITPFQVDSTFKDIDGNIVQKLNKYYDSAKGKIICVVNGETKNFNFPSDVLDKEDLAVGLANYPFEEKRDFIFHLFTHEPAMYTMTAKFLGQDPVMVSGKNVDCYKFRLIPDLGAANIFGAFVPATYFWVEVAPPHGFVRYEGLESGLGTPYIVMQKTK